MSKIFDFIGGLINPIKDLADELITTDEERQNFKIKLEQIKQESLNKAVDFQNDLIKEQSSVIQGEVSGNWLQRSWRPLLMLCFGFIVIYQFFISHFIQFFVDTAPDFDIPDQFWVLLQIGIGGYVAARSIEKITPKILEGNVKKKAAETKVEVLTKEVQELKTENMSAGEVRMLGRIKRKEARLLKRKKRREERQRARN